MALNVVLGQSTPLVVKLGSPTAPGAITPVVGNATLGDFLYNAFSQSLRNQVVKSATPGRLEVRATAGQPAFVAVGGRWGVVSGTIFHDSVVTGQRYLFADLSANNGAFVLTSGATATPGPWQMLLGDYYHSGTVIRSFNTGVLGLVTVGDILTIGGTAGGIRLNDRSTDGVSFDLYMAGGYFALETQSAAVPFQVNNLGSTSLTGTQAGLTLNDRSTAHATFLYRATNVFTFEDDANGVVFSFTAAGVPTFKGLSTAGYVKNSAAGVFSSQAVPIPITDGGTGGITAAAARTALSAAGSPANADITSMSALASITHALAVTGATTVAATSGVTPLAVSNVAGQSVDTFKVDASAVTNGQIVHVDLNGHLAVSQAALPTITPSTTGAGVGGAAVFGAGSTDQSGVIQVTTAGAPGATALVATIAFKTAMATAPRAVAFGPANAAAQTTAGQQAATFFTGYSTAGWTITSGGTALTTGTVYQWWYVVL